MRESPELCAVSDNESGVGADVDSDDVVDAVDSEAVVDAVDSEAVPVADSDEEPDDVDDEPDDDLEEPVSVGSANAIAGVLAMAAPTPIAAKPSSVIGVSTTRLSPNSFHRPRVTL